MKRVVAGQKIQNWHRPLGKHEPRASYLRTRFADPDIQSQSKQFVDVNMLYTRCFDVAPSGLSFGRYWESPFYQPSHVDDRDPLRNTNVFEVWNGQWSSNSQTLEVSREVYCPIQGQNAAEARKAFLQAPGAQTQYRIDILLDWFQKRRSTTFLRDLVIPESEVISSEVMPLEERLADFVDGLLYLADQNIPTNQLPALLFSGCDFDAISFVARHIKNPYLKTASCLFAPFWVRNPFTCDSSLDELAFVKALFGVYEAPEFLLLQDWASNSKHTLKWFVWFILLTQGGSLQRAAGLFDWWIPKRTQAHLAQCHQNTRASHAMFGMWLPSLGATATDCQRILRDHRFEVDPSDGLDTPHIQHFLLPAFQWLIRHAQGISDLEYRQILDWMYHLRTETELEHPVFCLRGLNLRSALHYSFEYAQNIGKSYGRFVWSKHGWDFSFTDEHGSTWEVLELSSSEELAAEGTVMRHCVAGYAGRCVRGISAIFSIRKNGRQEITVEINPVTLQVVQARGFQNRAANVEESAVLKQWLHHVLAQSSSEVPSPRIES